MLQFNWRDIPVERLKGGLTRQMLHGDSLTIARITLAKGAVVPKHSHPNEQISNVESGRLRFLFEGTTIEAGAGESIQIPSGLPHEVLALEDSVALDVFSPVRDDWRRGDDAYLREG